MVELAARQHNVVARWQLADLGFTRDMVRRRLEHARLHRVFRGSYSLTPRLTAAARMMAAALAYGPDAVLSHRSAAAAWDLGPWPTGAIDVTVPREAKAMSGIRLHRASVERVVKDAFPVTTVSRTLIDQAAGLPLGRLRDQFENAERLGVLDVTSIDEQMHRRRGARKIRAILAEWMEPEPTRSDLEDAFRAMCREARFPPPSFNVSVCGFDVDACWPQHKLIVELDSWQWHKTRAAFEEDRRKAAALEAAGYRVLRFTWRQVMNEPESIAAAVRSGCPTAGGPVRPPARAAARRSSGP